MPYKNKDDAPRTITRFMKAAAIGVPSGITASLVLALLFSAVLLRMSDPMAAIGIFAVAALVIGAFVSSLIPALLLRERSFTAALICAALYFLAVFIVSLAFRGESGTVNASDAVSGFGGCTLAALLSGFIARPRAARIKGGKKSPAAMARARLGRKR